MKRTVFISYSWDSEEHCSWVYSLVKHLRQANEITVLVDKDLKPGHHFLRVIEKAITEADYVLIICTPRYKEKADSGSGGVGYEGGIISNEIYCNHNASKFIPVLREGSFSTALPTFCAGRKGVDLSNDSADEFRALVQTILDDNYEKSFFEPPDSHHSNEHNFDTCFPIYWLIDCSGSMNGERIHAVNETAREIILDLQDSVWKEHGVQILFNVISFSTGAKIVCHNTDIDEFKWEDLDGSGMTCFGEALELLNEELSSLQRIKNRYSQMMSPVFILITDGSPTDNYVYAHDKISSNRYFNKGIRIAISIGDDADEKVLRQFVGEKGAVFDANDKEDIKRTLSLSINLSQGIITPIHKTGSL